MTHQTISETVRLNIRALRAEAGITQQQLADRAGFHVAFISKIESQKQNLTINVLEKIARGLKCEVERLVTTKEMVTAPGKQVEKLDAAIGLLMEFRARVVG